MNDLRSSFGDPVELQQSSKLTAKLQKKRKKDKLFQSFFKQKRQTFVAPAYEYVIYCMFVNEESVVLSV